MKFRGNQSRKRNILNLKLGVTKADQHCVIKRGDLLYEQLPVFYTNLPTPVPKSRCRMLVYNFILFFKKHLS